MRFVVSAIRQAVENTPFKEDLHAPIRQKTGARAGFHFHHGSDRCSVYPKYFGKPQVIRFRRGFKRMSAKLFEPRVSPPLQRLIERERQRVVDFWRDWHVPTIPE